ncbi:hypothetical protein BJX63DRAFT_444002 [Aspergillus granulosus]|uniref:Rhodopsin domain-containing protein n=1 Tax=Aspergillus granulosus TaxID=176169 RepID=A0ABR4H805_9EURO
MTLRVFTRWGLMKVLGLDDYLSIIAFIIYIARAVTLYVGLQGSGMLGNGRRIIITNWLMILLYTAGTWIIKLSFCAMLYKIVQSRALAKTIVLVAIAITIITIFEFFWTLFMCQPISKLWIGPEMEGTCHAGTTWGISLLVHGIALLVVDIALGIVVPLIVLHKVQMRMVLRVSVAVTIAVGSLASIATIARIYWTRSLFNNPGGAAENLSIWTDIEFGVNIICTAAITLKPLLRKAGVLTSLSETRCAPTYPVRGAGPGGGGMRIHVEEEVAIWTEAQAEGVVLEERRFSKG